MKRTAGLLVAVAVGAAIAVLALGCHRGDAGAADPSSASSASFVPIAYEDYRPDLGQGFAPLKGKKVRLMDFTNRADDTTQSTYASADKSITYGNPNSGFAGIGGRSVESYFWYCYQKALENVGMAVGTSSDPTDPAVPSMAITLKSITDQQFVLMVDVTRPGSPAVTKTITISEPAAAPGTPAADLSARAYKMMTMSVMAVLQDPEIAAALAK
jgi:hypothetical protein